MHYQFDLYGRFAGSSETATERSTETEPPEQAPDYNWNGIEWVFAPSIQIHPVVTQPVQPLFLPRVISKLQYMDRFTDAELAAIYSAAKTFVNVEIWLERFKLAQDVDLDDPRTVAGLHDLETAGLIGEGRAAGILS